MASSRRAKHERTDIPVSPTVQFAEDKDHKDMIRRGKECYERHLPHWQRPGAELFITWRLAGSLPAAFDTISPGKLMVISPFTLIECWKQRGQGLFG